MNVGSTLNGALCGAAILFAAACGETPQLPTDAESTVEQVQVSDGDVATTLAVKGRHTPDLMAIEGVVGTGLGMTDGRPVIRVYTVHGNVRGIPDHVENVPVERVVTGLIVAGTTTRERPAPNGYSIGHPDITAGTFGALVRNTSDNRCHALSNNHVLANSNNAKLGDSALQPGPYDGGTDPDDAIGALSDYEPILFDGSDNVMDAAIAEFVDAADAVGATPSSAYGAPGNTVVDALVGLNVQKFGRTTKLTQGTVQEVDVTVSVCYAGFIFCTSSATFVGQMSISDGTFSDGGDSGSLIVTDNANANPVGLLFAGSSTRTIANPIDTVLARFSAVIETNPLACANHGGGDGGATNSPPTAGFTWSATDLSVNFTDQSTDSDGTIASWSWDFGDGGTSTAQNPSHTYGSGGTYTVTLTVTDDDGATDSASQGVTVSESISDGITLSATGYKVRGLQMADLSWDGATSTNVDVFRDGSLIATTANDGFYTDNINNRGSGTYTYKVCEAGTSTCSTESTVSFS